MRYLLTSCLLLAASLTQAAPTLRVSDALPVLGQAVHLATDADQPATIVLADEAGTRDLGVVPAGQTLDWTPTKLGQVTLTARVGEQRSVSRTLFITPRRLQLNYWSCPPNQKWITSKLLGRGERPEDWLARGVRPLVWKWGTSHPDWKESASWAQHWTTELGGTPGVMIDEFGAGDAKDQVMGQALVAARAAKPDLFLAPYCLVAKGEAMIAGLKASDLVLAETYANDWRGYGVFDDRVGSVAAVCPDKALAVLGLRDWATTHLEVRRQIAYLRWSRPEMPGVAFFHTTTPRMMGAVDRAIYDYFLGPALRVERSATGAILHNIGCLPARDVRVRVGGQLQRVPTVAPDAKVTLAGADIVVEPVTGGYTVLDWHSPTLDPPPTDQENAAGAAWRAQCPKAEPLPDAAALALTRATEGQAGEKGQVTGGTLPLGRTLDGPWQMAFTLDLGRAYFYGRCGVHLEGENSLGFRWSHGDNDGDVPASQPRLVLEYRGPDGETARETFPPSLGPARRFRLVLGYDPRNGVRGQLLSAEGRLVYDTGNLPIDSAFRPSRLRYEVQPWAGSEVRYEAGVWHLRGVSGGPTPSPYVLESGLSELALSTGSLAGRPPVK